MWKIIRAYTVVLTFLQDLEMFWSLELVGIADPIDREGDDQALEKLY